MLNRPVRIPKYRLHKPTRQAVVRIDGTDVYLGVHGSPASRERYDRVIAEWLTAGRVPLKPSSRSGSEPGFSDITVNELLLRYLKHAEVHYVSPDGLPTGEVENVKDAIRPVKELYGTTLARQFGPLALRAIQQRMLDAREYRVRPIKATEGKGRWVAEHRVRTAEELARLDGDTWVKVQVLESREGALSRGVVNSRIARIRRLFKWAVSFELVPSSVYEALRTVAGLQRGRTRAREGKGVLPVAVADVEATLPFMPPPIRAMVLVQLYSGCRVGEVLVMRSCDVDRNKAVWEYRPCRHKGKYRGRERVVFLGAKAQEALAGFLLPAGPDSQSLLAGSLLSEGSEAFVFSPARWVAHQNAEKAARRKTKRQPSQVLGKRRKATPRRKPAAIYRRRSYRQAIRRACRRAGVAVWNPLQLRHTVATELRSRFGIEAARVILGHTKVETTQIYAERDLGKAAEIMGEIG